jgi:acyl-CoA ligase (AMP-forming) (exosortase A-associated)
MSIPQAISIFAISQAGGAFVPINTLLFPQQVAHIVNDCRMKVLITGASTAKALEPVLKDVSSLESLVTVSGGDEVDLSIRKYEFEEQCADVLEGSLPDVGMEKDLAAIMYSSGSTGKPKGIMLSHAQVMAGSKIVSNYLEIGEEDRTLAVLPFSFDAGLNQLMTASQHGATLVMMTFVFANEIVQMLKSERITGMGGVPTLWSLLAQPNSTLSKHELPHLRYISNTGGRMPQPVTAALRKALPTTKIFLMYGLTEAFRATYLPPEQADARPDSIGKAIPNTDILVIDDNGKQCEPGEVGQLVQHGPTVSMGYWGHPDLTAKVFRPHPLLPPELADSEMVCYSGDLVRRDENGYLYFVARKDHMIKTSGFRVSPTEVEELLFQSGLVREAAVIGVPDEMLGYVIKAFVVPRDGETMGVEQLTAYCAENSPAYMVPKMVEVLEELPKTPSRKIDYPELRRREGLA